MPIESESRENFRMKRLLNCNSFPIHLNDNGVNICSVLPEREHPSHLTDMHPFKTARSPRVIFDSCVKIGKYSPMEGEYFLNRAQIVHWRITARYCYYIVIHLFRSGIYLAKS
jgi:hypothetical protein